MPVSRENSFWAVRNRARSSCRYAVAVLSDTRVCIAGYVLVLFIIYTKQHSDLPVSFLFLTLLFSTSNSKFNLTLLLSFHPSPTPIPMRIVARCRSPPASSTLRRRLSASTTRRWRRSSRSSCIPTEILKPISTRRGNSPANTPAKATSSRTSERVDSSPMIRVELTSSSFLFLATKCEAEYVLLFEITHCFNLI